VNFVGWAKARSAVPTIYLDHRFDNGGHATLCPPYEAVNLFMAEGGRP